MESSRTIQGIVDNRMCCGCGACAQKCPKQCISLKADSEGFGYPVVDLDFCVGCGLCQKVCPVLEPYNVNEPLVVLAAINRDKDIRMHSSSGGIFTFLAERVLKNSGVVFGARFDAEWQVVIDYTTSIDGLGVFRGSKYVQARTGDTYKQCEDFLKTNRKVLYTGTPCQIAGLRHYLRKEYDNLITCAIACHGVPSPKVWRVYLNDLIHNEHKTITDIQFRNKIKGWKSYHLKFTYITDKNKETSQFCSYKENIYMQTFLNNMSLRPSCYNCMAKQGRSMADITIADFWGIDNCCPELDDDKGTSLVIIHSQKGWVSFDWSRLHFVKTKYKDAILNNSCISYSPNPHKNRTKFFNNLDTTPLRFSEFAKKCLEQSLIKRIIGKIFKLSKSLIFFTIYKNRIKTDKHLY